MSRASRNGKLGEDFRAGRVLDDRQRLTRVEDTVLTKLRLCPCQSTRAAGT